MRARTAYERATGFTLLEVVIALTLMFVLTVVLSGSVSFGNRVWERTARTTRESGDMVSAYQFLETSFGNLVKPQNLSIGRDENQDFVGSSQEVSFRTSGFAEVGLAGPHRVTLRLVADRIEVHLPTEEDAGAEPQFADHDFVLMSGLGSWAIAYKGSGANVRNTNWVDEWPGNIPPPGLIRFTLRSTDAEERIWFFRLPAVHP
jgi:general secretion pathway protein J